MNRAYSILSVKEVNEDLRVIEGIASTPNPDRMGDVVEPLGAEFKLPIPLLWQHNSREPIGEVLSAKVTKDGIAFRAKFAKTDEPGKLKDRLDEAWQSVKIGLIKGVSIGFRSLEETFDKVTSGYIFKRWEWLELSAVTIPANVEATITAIKSADQPFRKDLAASGDRVVRLDDRKTPGATGSLKGKAMKTIQEQIAALEAKRAASAARREEIQGKAITEGRTKDEAEKQEFDTLSSEIKAIDDELVDLKLMETQAIAKAKPAAGADPKQGSESRGNSGIISVKRNVEKGIAYTRLVKSLIEARGNLMLAKMHAESQKEWADSTPEVVEFLKTSIAAGTTTTSGWASQIVYNQDLVNEFIDLLRPMTVIGKLTGLTKVPFNVRVAGQDSGASANWVGQGAAVPVSKLNTLEVTLGIAKAQGLVVLTKELIKSSSPSAEMLVRNDLMKTITEFLDRRFLDPNYAAVANVSPASITNGVTATVPSGTNLAAIRADIQTLFRAFIAVNDDPTTATWITDHKTALTLSMAQNALGQNEFAGMGINGGTLAGLPVVVSNSANITGSPDSGSMLILVKQSDIMLADDGQIEIDASDQATVEMTDTPIGNSVTPAAMTTNFVSMFQSNSVALKATRFINWTKKRSTAVAYIKEAQYVA